MENVELQHHGTKGMKWGVRRYQNSDGSLTPAGKKRYGIVGTIKEHAAAKKKQKQRAAALEKAREVKKTKAEEAAEKKRVLESGTAEEVMRYKGRLSNKELSDAYSRLNYERLISDLSAKEIQAGSEQVESLLDKAGRWANNGQKALDTWNKSAKIVNALTKADLPTFEGNKKSKEAESALERLVKSGNAEQVEKHLGKFTAKQLQDVNTRFRNEDMIKERAASDKASRKAAEEAAKAKKQVDDYNSKWTKGEVNDSVTAAKESTYSKSGKDIADSKWADVKDSEPARNGKTFIAGLLETKAETVTGTVEGEGTSRSNMKDNSTYQKKEKPSNYYDPIDSYFIEDMPVHEVRSSEPARIGQSYINELFLLEDKSR